jgi:hypothetical protein
MGNGLSRYLQKHIRVRYGLMDTDQAEDLAETSTECPLERGREGGGQDQQGAQAAQSPKTVQGIASQI